MSLVGASVEPRQHAHLHRLPRSSYTQLPLSDAQLHQHVRIDYIIRRGCNIQNCLFASMKILLFIVQIVVSVAIRAQIESCRG